jgi:hypothetical protein
MPKAAIVFIANIRLCHGDEPPSRAYYAPVSETDDYILRCIKTWVWSGFYGPDDIQEMLGDVLEPDADEAMLRAAVESELAAKATAEVTWPRVTDCDRLDAVFAELDQGGVMALQNAGYTMSDGRCDVGERLAERDRDQVKGYCFYHGQDLERAVTGGGLMLAFGNLDADVSGKQAIGNLVAATLRKAGFEVDWNGDAEKRIHLPRIDWKRRRR